MCNALPAMSACDSSVASESALGGALLPPPSASATAFSVAVCEAPSPSLQKGR